MKIFLRHDTLSNTHYVLASPESSCSKSHFRLCGTKKARRLFSSSLFYSFDCSLPFVWIKSTHESSGSAVWKGLVTSPLAQHPRIPWFLILLRRKEPREHFFLPLPNIFASTSYFILSNYLVSHSPNTEVLPSKPPRINLVAHSVCHSSENIVSSIIILFVGILPNQKRKNIESLWASSDMAPSSFFNTKAMIAKLDTLTDKQLTSIMKAEGLDASRFARVMRNRIACRKSWSATCLVEPKISKILLACEMLMWNGSPQRWRGTCSEKTWWDLEFSDFRSTIRTVKYATRLRAQSFQMKRPQTCLQHFSIPELWLPSWKPSPTSNWQPSWRKKG